jgi:hypothetical protein
MEIPRAPPSAVQEAELLLVAGSDTKLKVYWTEPTTDNGAIVTHYDIQWSLDSTFGAGNVFSYEDTTTILDSDRIDQGLFEYTIQNLIP